MFSIFWCVCDIRSINYLRLIFSDSAAACLRHVYLCIYCCSKISLLYVILLIHTVDIEYLQYSSPVPQTKWQETCDHQTDSCRTDD